jgi:hypothetical protein
MFRWRLPVWVPIVVCREVSCALAKISLTWLIFGPTGIASAAELTLLSDAPVSQPLLISLTHAANPLLISVVNSVANDPSSEFMTGWQFRLVIAPDAGTIGSLQFNAGAKPSPYVFDGVGNLGAPSATVGGVFSALDTAIPTNVGVQIPTAPAANLQLVTFTPSPDANGTFGIYAKDSSDTFWIDANGQSRQFNNIPNGAGMVRIADVLVSPLGDINRDGQVTVADVSTLMNALVDLNDYQSTHQLTNQDLLDLADINGDGQVNNADLQALISLVANNFVGGSSLATVPEPATLTLSVIGLSVFVIRRLRTHSAH